MTNETTGGGTVGLNSLLGAIDAANVYASGPEDLRIVTLRMDAAIALIREFETPETALWIEGEPQNLTAAAEDAYEWLAYTNHRAGLLGMNNSERFALERAMLKLERFMRPNSSYPDRASSEPSDVPPDC